jgi:hypothetical protein
MKQPVSAKSVLRTCLAGFGFAVAAAKAYLLAPDEALGKLAKKEVRAARLWMLADFLWGLAQAQARNIRACPSAPSSASRPSRGRGGSAQSRAKKCFENLCREMPANSALMDMKANPLKRGWPPEESLFMASGLLPFTTAPAWDHGGALDIDYLPNLSYVCATMRTLPAADHANPSVYGAARARVAA